MFDFAHCAISACHKDGFGTTQAKLNVAPHVSLAPAAPDDNPSLTNEHH
jgi:hypothetical protein